MVEISLSGSGEGPGKVTTRGYSTTAITHTNPTLKEEKLAALLRRLLSVVGFTEHRSLRKGILKSSMGG